MSVARVAQWRDAIVAVALLWAVTMLVVVVATGALPAREAVAVAPAPGFGGWAAPPVDASGLELLRTGLVRHDALWYLAIASDGYPTTTAVPQAAAFLPAYPALVAGVAALLGGRLVLAGLLVAFVATVASVVGMQRLAGLLRGADGSRSRRTTVTLVTLLFPTSFFLLAPYAESLLLATSVWALVLAAEDRPVASAGLAALATVARPTGALLALPLLLGVVAARRPPRRWWRDRAARTEVVRRQLVPASGVALGGITLLLYGAVLWGDPLAVVNAQDGWQRAARFPLATLWDAVRFGLDALGGGATVYHLLDVVVLGMTLTGTVVLARRREWPLVLHALASMVLWLSQPFPGRPLMSTPRFALAVPAVVLGLAALADGDGLRRAVVPLSAVLFAVHLVLFTRWWYVF